MANPLDLKHIGKLGEEVCECGAAIFRCVIQGIDESEPVTGKVNRDWLTDEIADVEANIELVKQHFALDRTAIVQRVTHKITQLRTWHEMLAGDRASLRVVWIAHGEDAIYPCYTLELAGKDISLIVATIEPPGDDPLVWAVTFHPHGNRIGRYATLPAAKARAERFLQIALYG